MGHSTRSLDEFIELLRRHQVELLVDIRTVPASRRMPHFTKGSLQRTLPAHGIDYTHLPELGGLRKPDPASINTGWRNVSFRGYADYMQTEEFWAAIDQLQSLSASRRVAMMCAEALPWRCHRSLVADALTVRRLEVRHITGMSEPALHAMTPFARVEGGRLTYPASHPDTLPL